MHSLWLSPKELQGIVPGPMRPGSGSPSVLHKVRVEVELALPLRGGKRMVCASGTREARVDAALVTALRKAHRLTRREQGIPLVDAAPASPYDRMILRLAFLEPDLQRDILAGRQPPGCCQSNRNLSPIGRALPFPGLV